MTDLVKILSDYDLSLPSQRASCIARIMRSMQPFHATLTPFANVWDAYQLITLVDVKPIHEKIRDMNSDKYIVGTTLNQENLFWHLLIDSLIAAKDTKTDPHPYDSPAAKIHTAFRKFALLTNTSSNSKTNLVSYDPSTVLKAATLDEASRLAAYRPEPPKKEFWNSGFGIFLSCLPLFIPAIIRGYRCSKKHGDWKFWQSDHNRKLQEIKNVISSVKSEIETALNSNTAISGKLSNPEAKTHSPKPNLTIQVDKSKQQGVSPLTLNTDTITPLGLTAATHVPNSPDQPYDIIYGAKTDNKAPNTSPQPYISVSSHTPPSQNKHPFYQSEENKIKEITKDGSKDGSKESSGELVGEGSDEDIQASLDGDSPQRTTPTPN